MTCDDQSSLFPAAPPVRPPESLVPLRLAADLTGLDGRLIAAAVLDGRLATWRIKGEQYVDLNAMKALEPEE